MKKMIRSIDITSGLQKTLLLVLLLYAISLAFNSCRKSNFIVPETISIVDNGSGVGTTTWTKDKDYLIEGFVFINDGQVLTIEPGTVIRAKTGQAENASALIVARGGKIIAEGTREEPIIFTVEGDDLEGSVPLTAKGLWGGLIVLGNASLNNSGNEDFIEGIPRWEPRGIYGGTFDEDDSGILKYISIRHGGTNIGESNEINGLTLGGVGSGTEIEYIEVISNTDDGVEFFGGTVHCKYMVSAFCGDDAFDFDEGYRGKGQFWLGLQEISEGDNLAEHDGGINPVAGRPYSIPLLANVTYIGRGNEPGKTLITFKDNAGGKYYNSVFLNQFKGVNVEYVEDEFDSYQQFLSGNLVLENNVFFNISDNHSSAIFKVYSEHNVDLSAQNDLLGDYFQKAGNTIIDPGLEVKTEYFDLMPDLPDWGSFSEMSDPFFKRVGFKGAFGVDNWLSGWTLLDKSGLIK